MTLSDLSQLAGLSISRTGSGEGRVQGKEKEAWYQRDSSSKGTSLQVMHPSDTCIASTSKKLVSDQEIYQKNALCLEAVLLKNITTKEVYKIK